ncbi:MAG: beta galactosidase jelly roll domain-containing protein [Bacteroidaceae bacterium]|nr:beta galactosidase jelly roll domain-containing protein [Bacteroidaceae bacterium]
MKTRFLYSFFFLLAWSITLSAQPSFGDARLLNDGWRFRLEDDSAFVDPAFNDTRWQYVAVPHDWGVSQAMSPDAGSCQGYLPGGIGWYRNHLRINASELTDDQRLFIYFEGVYNRSSVYLNGHLLGYRPSGFASFLYDLTPYINKGGDNVLAVRVDHSRQNDSRWYTGSGIYRPVWLVSAPQTHIALWGTSWQIQSLNDKKAVVQVKVDIENEAADSRVVVDILDATGTVVASAKGKDCRLSISRPHRWSLSNPYLYKVRARLLSGSTQTDCSEVPLGLRTLEFSPDHGFALNGQWMKVKGVCLHDDAGTLGTAVPADVWRQRLLTLKSIGTNAIRMSHNPHAPALYSLCDSLGLLVMDEASDEWEFPKRKWLKGWNQGTPGYEGTFDYFEEWIDRDVADMVRRDRCHPSIFLWSIGNEVDYPNDPYTHPILDGGTAGFTQPMYGGYKPDQPNAERIGVIAQRLSKIVRDIDPSRAVTGALAGVVMSNQTAYPEAVDVVGYNYTESRYGEDHQQYPKRVIYGSENRHDYPSWKAVRDNEHIFGQFLWTGIDYLGESGAWPARGSGAGLLDLAGYVKPNGYYRASLWSESPTCYVGAYPINNGQGRQGQRQQARRRQQPVSSYAPAIWNYEDGQTIRVVCYTNAPSARLLLCPRGKDSTVASNFQPIGGEPTLDEATGILYWDIPYAAGSLRCEASNGATSSITTCDRPYALRATVDKKSIEQGQVALVHVEVIDEAGNLVPLADNNITCYALGSARILGLENGDLRDTDVRSTRALRANGGRLLAYVVSSKGQRQNQNPIADNAAADGQTSQARIIFSSPLLQPAEVSIELR